MDYQVTISTDNAAFDDGESIETARILRRLAGDVETMGLCQYVLRDINGNQVGEAGFEIIPEAAT